MGVKSNTAQLKLLQDANKSILLRGEQGRLQGKLFVENSSTSKLSLNSIPIENVKIRDSSQVMLNELRVRGRLKAKEKGTVNVDVPIDPSTAPGVYSATLTLGGKQQQAEITVVANVELEIEPDTVTINTQIKSGSKTTFDFCNVGNVDVLLGEKLIVPIQSDKLIESSLQQSFSELLATKSKEINMRDVISAIAKNMPEPLVLSFAKTTIKPGMTQSIAMTMTLPNNLLPHRYYFADIELYSSGIHFDIYT